MASDNITGRQYVPLGWMGCALLCAFGGGWCYASGKFGWCALSLILTAICAFFTIKRILHVGKSVHYIMNATLNGDFSYKFPTDNVGKYERNTNLVLNRIVEHLERLTSEIRQKETFLARVINMTDIGMVVTDANGNVRLHNESALRMLQRPALTHVCQISPQAYSDLSITKYDATLNGKVIHIYTINDLRHPIQTAEVESWEKLIRVLTHEIMNSLTPIRSIAETMKDKAVTNDMEEALDAISSSSRSLMNFVRNFRQFCVLPEVQMRAVCLKPLLEKCLRMGETYANNNDTRFELTCFPPDVMAYTDEALLSRVITNILKNATEASPLIISIEAKVLHDESVEICISNDGELIADDLTEQIFTPFFTTRPSGNGIGLSLSRRIITHLGGTLTLRSRPYTSFTIRI